MPDPVSIPPVGDSQSDPVRPGISILKPLKGADDTTRETLRSWFTQDYSGPIQILFGVHSVGDPAGEIVGSLIREFPAVNARLVVCAELLGPNAKVSTLIQLARLARHPLLVVSDGDVRITHPFLSKIVPLLANSSVGLVNSFYRIAAPVGFFMELEAAAVNTDFWSQVLQARTLGPQRFALGAAMLFRKMDLDAIGGFESLVEYLADDFQLGRRLAEMGLRIQPTPVVVDCWEAPMTAAAVWAHQVRWARTIRVCQPLHFAASVVTHTSFWALMTLGLAIHSIHTMAGISILILRMILAVDLRRRIGDRLNPSRFLLTPLRDAMGVILWVSAFTSNRIEWRGRCLRVQPSGRMVLEG